MKTLVLYASKHGCAEDAAKYLVSKLNHNADCADLKSFRGKDLQEYDWIVVGGSVYAGRVMKKAVRFCEQNQNVLLEKNVVLFVSCTPPDRATEYMRKAFPSAIFNHATEKVNFGGEIRPEKLSFLMRRMIERIRQRSGGSKKVGINYDNIGKLAKSINAAV